MLRIYLCTILLVVLIFESKCIVVYECLAVYCLLYVLYAAVCGMNDDDEKVVE